MVRGCIVAGCSNRAVLNRSSGGLEKRTYNSGTTFHLFPKDKNMRQKWLAAIGRGDYKPGKYSSVCSEHFQVSDFNKKYTNRFLEKHAIPSIFDMPPKKSRRRSVLRCLKKSAATSQSSSGTQSPMKPRVFQKSVIITCIQDLQTVSKKTQHTSNQILPSHADPIQDAPSFSEPLWLKKLMSKINNIDSKVNQVIQRVAVLETEMQPAVELEENINGVEKKLISDALSTVRSEMEECSEDIKRLSADIGNFNNSKPDPETENEFISWK